MKKPQKKIRHLALTGILVLTLMTVGTTTLASPRRNNHQRIMEKIETIKMWKLMDALNLDSQTALKVFPIIKKMDQERYRLRQKKRELLRRIQIAISGNQTKEKIDDLASNLFDLKTKISNLSREEYQKLKAVLSEKQLGKFLLFQQGFRRELIRRWLRERRGPGRGMRGQGKAARPLPSGTP